jgi:hypothetical protein
MMQVGIQQAEDGLKEDDCRFKRASRKKANPKIVSEGSSTRRLKREVA